MGMNHLTTALEAFKDQTIMVIGDLILDEYLLTSTGRVSREAPVLVTDFESSHHCLGGAGNVIMNLHRLGAKVMPVGFVGDDDTARTICSILDQAGITCDGLQKIKNGITPKKSRILAGAAHTRKQQILRIDYTMPLTIQISDRQILQEKVKSHLANSQAVILSDYLNQTLQGDWISTIRDNNAQIPIITDSRRHFRLFKGSSIITPNEDEFCSLFDIRPSSEQDFWAGIDKILAEFDLGGMIVKRGHLGMMIADNQGHRLSLPVHGTTQIVDVTGAGDTVIALVALGLASGLSLFESAQLSNIAASLVVMHEGTYALSNNELLHELQKNS